MRTKYITYLFVITIFSMQAIACIINYFVDTSHIWANYEEMAKLSLQGKIVATPANYNEREYQHQIIKNQKKIPNTIIIGSSRGMYLGKEILKQESLYNHCVSGGNLFDYFAIIGLYQKYCNKIPKNIIFEVSPWVFSDVTLEERWKENYTYRISAYNYYELITKERIPFITKNIYHNNPFFSFTYMYTNIGKIIKKCLKLGIKKGLVSLNYNIHISKNEKERAELPDGTIRYNSEQENYNKERTKKVIVSSSGPVSYQNCDKQKAISISKYSIFKLLIDFLKKQKIKITIFLVPFSKTQCNYIYQKNSNPIFNDIENQLIELGQNNNITIIGSYNSNKYNLIDDDFIDFMHNDKNTIKKIWKNNR